MYKRLKIEQYLIAQGYNKELIKELDNNEKLVIRVLDSEILEKTNTKKV